MNHRGKPMQARQESREAAVMRRRSSWIPRRVEPGTVRLLQPLSPWAWVAAATLALCGTATQYPLLTMACVMTVPLLATLLLIKGESPILFFCAMMQWLQATLAVFCVDVLGGTLERNFAAPEMEQATWLSLRGVLALAVGMRLALGRWRTATGMIASEARSLSVPRLFRLWWIAFFGGGIIYTIGWAVPGFSQVGSAFSSFKWVFFFMLGIAVLARNEGYAPLITVMAVEFGSGLFGFFSTFKEVLIMFLVVVLTSDRRFSARVRIWTVAVMIVGIVTSVFWSAIKGEYRRILTRGDVAQQVEVPVAVRLQALDYLFKSMSWDKMGDGMFATFNRVAYTPLFGDTLAYVPRCAPYEGGQLWLGAVKHILMPRIFFPNKAVIEDSERARKYTGIKFAGKEAATSIGIGYYAESYVDFGPVGMMAPIFGVGLLMGGIFRYFTLRGRSRLLGTALATAILFSMLHAYETSNMKVLGVMLIRCLVLGPIAAVYGLRVMRYLSAGVPGRR